MKEKTSITFTFLILLMIVSTSVVASGEVINPDFILPREQYKYGGTLTLGTSQDVDTLNPFESWGWGWQATIMMYESLVMIGPNYEIRPWLAKDWDVSDDGLTITFYLQEEATWSDGVPLTAEDVEFTWQRTMEQGLSKMSSFFEKINSVEATDEHTVVFHLKENDVRMFTEIFPSHRACVVPKHIWENVEDWSTYDNDDPDTAIGSGPFIYDEWRRDEYITLKANEDYWMGRPYLDRVTWRVVRMQDANVMMFDRGDIDKLALSGFTVSKYLDPEKFFITLTEDAALSYWQLNLDKEPTSDLEFRRALEYLVDRDFINELAYYGFGVPMRHILPTQHEGDNWVPPEDMAKEFDLDNAVEILENAGYLDVDDDGWRETPDGEKMKLDFVVPGDEDRYVKSMNALVDDLQNAGINVESFALEGGALDAKLGSGDFHFSVGRFGASSPEPLVKLSWFLSDSWTSFDYINSEYDELFYTAISTVDVDERRSILWEMQRILANDVVMIPLVNRLRLNAYNAEKFGGYSTVNPYGPLSNDKMWPYLNIHLKGAPDAKPLILTLQVSETSTENEPTTFTVTVKDESGAPIEGLYIDFYVDNINVGATRSESDGTGEFTWILTQEGTFNVKAGFMGNPTFSQSTSNTETTIVTSTSPPPPESTPNYTMYYVIGAVIIIAVAVFLYSRMNKT